MRRLFALVLGLALVAAACGGDEDGGANGATGGGATEEGPVPINITMTSWIGYGLFHLAEEQGFFDDHGIDMTITVIEDEATVPPAIEGNQLQGILTTVDTNVRFIAAGLDLVQILVVDDSNGADGIVATGDIQSVEDLAGRDVGVKVASTSYVFFLSVLKDAGMSVEDINVVDMTPGEAGTAFVAGQVDAAVTWEPFLSRATKREGGHVLISSAEAPGLIVDALGVRRDWLEQHPDAATELIAAYNDAYNFWQENPDEALPVMAASQDVSTADYEETLPGVTFYGPDQIAEFMNAPADQTGILKLTGYINDFWVEEGVIEQPIDAEKHIDGSFAQQAAEQA